MIRDKGEIFLSAGRVQDIDMFNITVIGDDSIPWSSNCVRSTD